MGLFSQFGRRSDKTDFTEKEYPSFKEHRSSSPLIYSAFGRLPSTPSALHTLTATKSDFPIPLGYQPGTRIITEILKEQQGKDDLILWASLIGRKDLVSRELDREKRGSKKQFYESLFQHKGGHQKILFTYHAINDPDKKEYPILDFAGYLQIPGWDTDTILRNCCAYLAFCALESKLPSPVLNTKLYNMELWYMHLFMKWRRFWEASGAIAPMVVVDNVKGVRLTGDK